MEEITNACTCCHRTLRLDEVEPSVRVACRLCETRGVEALRTLPALYRQTAHQLQPGTSKQGGRVSGSKSAPMPCSEAVLNFRAAGGMVTVLAEWERAFRGELRYTEPPFRGDYQQTLDGVVQFLVNAAPWVYASFAAVDEYHREVQQIAGQARAIVTGEQPARRVTVTCHCGAPLRITLDTPGRRCGTCGQQYGWAELRQLPLAERTAA